MGEGGAELSSTEGSGHRDRGHGHGAAREESYERREEPALGWASLLSLDTAPSWIEVAVAFQESRQTTFQLLLVLLPT
jgi:hypothetical protein